MEHQLLTKDDIYILYLIEYSKSCDRKLRLNKLK